jgi:glycosyltransferase involved in cell wall biosynthesis
MLLHLAKEFLSLGARAMRLSERGVATELKIDSDLCSTSEGAPGLSILIPVYRGAATIAELVGALSVLQPHDGLELILVNDGSPDDSDEVCRRLVQEASVSITYIEHTRNFGEHNAIMTGLRHARGKYIITMDDDLQNPPEEVLKVYEYAKSSCWDVVYTYFSRKEHPLWRNVGSWFANVVADHLLDKPKGLYLSSFRCISALVAQSVSSYEGPYPYIDGLIFQVTQRVGTVEVRHLPRAKGLSTYGFRRLVRLWLNLATCFSLAPLRLAIYSGATMAILGALGAVATIVEALTSGTPSGWASIMVMLLVIGGVQSLMAGIIGEYVGRAFLSANGKPQAAVRSIDYARPEEEGRSSTGATVIGMAR